MHAMTSSHAESCSMSEVMSLYWAIASSRQRLFEPEM